MLQSWTGPFVPEPPHSPFYRSHAYKAPFNVTGTGAVETIVLPMNGEKTRQSLCFPFETHQPIWRTAIIELLKTDGALFARSVHFELLDLYWRMLRPRRSLLVCCRYHSLRRSLFGRR